MGRLKAQAQALFKPFNPMSELISLVVSKKKVMVRWGVVWYGAGEEGDDGSVECGVGYGSCYFVTILGIENHLGLGWVVGWGEVPGWDTSNKII